MVTGASTADLAVILIDARKGVLTQTRRHSYLVSLLGIRHVVLAVNKMDLVGYAQEVFDAIVARLPRVRRAASASTDVVAIPMSALHGRQRHRAAARTRPGTTGPTLMEHLETVRDRRRRCSSGRSACRCSGSTGRTSTSAASPGTIAGGTVRPGDARARAALGPREHASRASSRMDGDLERGRRRPGGHAHARRRDRRQPRRRARRGRRAAPRSPTSSRRTLVWMADEPMLPGPAVPAEDRHADRSRRRSREPKYKVNVNTLEHLAAKTARAQRDRRLQPRRSTSRSPSTPTPRTATPAASSSSTASPTTRSAPGMLHFALRRAHNIHWQALDVEQGRARRRSRARSRACCGSPACPAPASRPSPTWSRSSCTRWAGTPTCSTATTCATG